MTTRDQIVEEARSWIGTPYVKRGELKGVGTDCACLIYCTLLNVGLISPSDLGYISSDWWAHTTDEVYMKRMMRHASKVLEGLCTRALHPEPGDVILCKAAGAHVFNHGAIITDWPKGVHAVQGGVVEIDLTRDPMWMMREVAIFDPLVKVSDTV